MIFFDTSSLLKTVNGEPITEHFAISSITFSELEEIKTSGYKDPEIKYAARRLLHFLRDNTDLYDVVIYKPEMARIFFDYELNNDIKILSCALALKNEIPDLIFATEDLSLAAIASICFKNDCIISYEIQQNLKSEYNGYEEYKLNEADMADFYSNQHNNTLGLYINEYANIYDLDENLVDTVCWTGEEYRHLNYRTFDSRWFGDIKPLKGDIYQAMVADSFINNKITMVKGSAGSGKAQPNSTLIPVPSGDHIPLGAIRVGDYVLDRTGKPTKVLGVFPQGKIDNYKITFADGRTSYCNEEHLWTTYTSKGNFKARTVKEMLEHGIWRYKSKNNTTAKTYYYQIPVNKPVVYPEFIYDIDPYVMGCFLGDGCCLSPRLTFSSNDEYIVNEIGRLINAQPRKASQFNYNWSFYYPETETHYSSDSRKYKLKCIQTKTFFELYLKELVADSYHKRIPQDYKIGSIQQRQALLQGLLDTDGTIGNDGKGRIRYTSVNLDLIKDVQEICWSLGYLATISEDNRKEKYKGGACYSLLIQCPSSEKIKLFRLPRKKNIAISYHNSTQNNASRCYDRISIVNIEKMANPEEMTCIYVDNNEHLYLTNDYLVSHNTILSLGYLMHMLDRGKIDKIIIFCNTVATKDSARLGLIK